jgi:hypothetical protein
MVRHCASDLPVISPTTTLKVLDDKHVALTNYVAPRLCPGFFLTCWHPRVAKYKML